MGNLPAESIKRRVEDLIGIVDWVAGIWHSKNWVRKLVLVDVLLFIAFNPSFPTVLRILPGSFIPLHYELYFWAVIGLFFVIALVIGIRAKSAQSALPELDKRSPIKGLLPFDTADEAVFAGLQRHNELIECQQAIIDHNFRLGILSADSGNGKTSFLQAGLLPALQKSDHGCVYVKLTELDPVISIKQALASRLPPDIPPDATLSELLRSAARSEDKEMGPFVLLLDQFEQFFVHQKRRKDREPLIRQLSEWYNRNYASPVKLLISIRSDFHGRLNELQKAMGHSLGPHQIFTLEKFAPEQAADVFRVLAESAQLECDRSFIEEMTAQELAASDDGYISPVDIQILAWMIARQSTGEERAFTRSAFQKLGGVEGLLERFLTRALDARETPPRRQAATKVLLALTDLERNTRAGMRTLDDLRHNLGGALSDSELREAVEWLTRGDVRLAALVKRDDVEGYELAHERLIPALRRIANKELTEADRANLLIDRRTNEWQGNNRNKRYLFSWRELRLISKQTPFLQSGQNRNVKRALIATSKKRLRDRFVLATLPFLLFMTAALIWYSQWGQLQLIKWDVTRLSKDVTNVDALSQVAKAYSVMAQFSRAQEVAEMFSRERDKISVLIEIAKVMAKIGTKQQAIELLKQAQGAAENIVIEDDRASAFGEVARAMVEIAAEQRDQELLKQAQGVAEKISDEDSKASVLIEIAKVMAEIGTKLQTIELLKQAQGVAEKISDEDSKASVLFGIVKVMGEIGAEQRDQELLKQAQGVAEKISDEDSKASALGEIAKVMAEIGAKQQDQELLKQAQGVAEKISDEDSKASALGEIAKVMAEIGAKQQDQELLKQAQGIAEKISYKRANVDARAKIAEVMAEIGAKQQAVELLRQAQGIAEEISGEESRAAALEEIAKVMTEIGAKQRDQELLKQAQGIAEKISDESKAAALGEIAKVMAEIGAKQQAIELVRQAQGLEEEFGDEDRRAFPFEEITKAMTEIGAKQWSIELLKQAQRSAEKDLTEDYRVNTLSEIAKVMAEIGAKQQAIELLKQALRFAVKISNVNNGAESLKEIAKVVAAIGDFHLARAVASKQVNKVEEVDTLALILETWARSKDPRLAEKARDSRAHRVGKD